MCHWRQTLRFQKPHVTFPVSSVSCLWSETQALSFELQPPCLVPSVPASMDHTPLEPEGPHKRFLLQVTSVTMFYHSSRKYRRHLPADLTLIHKTGQGKEELVPDGRITQIQSTLFQDRLRGLSACSPASPVQAAHSPNPDPEPGDHLSFSFHLRLVCSR